MRTGFVQERMKDQCSMVKDVRFFSLMRCGWVLNIFLTSNTGMGEQGWSSGGSTRLPPLWPGFKPRVDAKCRLSLLLVLSPAPRGFFWVLQFSLQWDGLNFGKVVSVRVKTFSNTNLVTSSHIKKWKASLPVDVHRSKTGLLTIDDLRFDSTALNG